MDTKNENIDDRPNIELWVRQYTGTLYDWALFKTSNKETAEDLIQETFLTAHQQLPKFRGESSPQTWLLAILNNKINAHFRKRYKQIDVNKNQEMAINDNAIFNQLFDKDDRWKNIEKPLEWHAEENHLLDDTEFNRVLASCLGNLPEHWRLAVNLKFIEQKKGELICQELDIAPTNFWQILHRAKLQLRKCLEINWFNA